MKKIFAFAITSLIASYVQAQTAFKQIGLSIEGGTTGLGINISYPVVTDHLIISAGYNFPEFGYKQNVEVGTEYVNEQINNVKEIISLYNSVAPQQGLSPINGQIQNINKISADVDAKLNFGNFKIMLQYYPTTQSSFYLTAGVFIGNGEMGSIIGDLDKEAWATYKQAIEINNLLPKEPISVLGHRIGRYEGLDEAVRFSVGDQTFQIRPEDEGHIETKVLVKKVKPYVGLGFGNSVPQRHRVGFQMEIGAYYQGKPTFVSDQEVPYDNKATFQKDISDIKDMVQKLTWYPQLTFRITGRIF